MNPEADVVVIGGGSAGVAAALASARQGVKTLLVERYGYLGGAGTASLVHSFCGLYKMSQPHDPHARLANPGIPADLDGELLASGAALGPVRMGKVDVLLHQPQQLALLYDRWCLSTFNLQLLLHTDVVGCDKNEDRISALHLHCRGRRWTVAPQTVVDASGDAVLAPLAGHAFEETPPQHLQRPAYIVGLSGVAGEALTGDGPLKIAGTLARAIKDQALPAEAAGAHFRMSAARGEVFLTLDLPGDTPGLPYDGQSPASLTWVEMRGREVVFAIVEHLRTTLEGFADAHISVLPARAGIRESRRWAGVYELTEEDILQSRIPADTVAWATWPLELRETARGPRLIYPQAPTPAGIPLRSLRARHLSNVFVAGRCMAASHAAQASIRVMGTALATGQAAGLAAALMTQANGVEASAEAVRAKLGLELAG